jgi:hypothetical protein
MLGRNAPRDTVENLPSLWRLCDSDGESVGGRAISPMDSLAAARHSEAEPQDSRRHG